MIVAISLSPRSTRLSPTAMESSNVRPIMTQCPNRGPPPAFFSSCCWRWSGTCCGRCRHKLVDGYRKAREISPWVGYVYLAVVGVGGLLLAALLISILLHIWKNTRQKSAERERRNLSPSEMSAGAAGAGVER